MGLFDFFKKKPETKTKIIKIDELDNYISDKKGENKSKEKELLENIRNSIDIFINELSEKNNVLKNIDINGKKADSRAKFIIKENLFHYIESLEKLINQLKEVEPDSLTDLIKDVDSLFIDFEERSRLNFEKATFLIGKELGDVKDAINNFIRNLKRLLDENKSFLESIEIISSIEIKLEELDENEKLLTEIERKKNENTLKINTIEADILSVELELEKLKSSDSYRKEIEIETQIKLKKEDLEKEVYELKEMVNFKKLANIFHYDPKKMAIINEYKLNFMKTFERDRLLSLIPLLNDANITDSFITKKTTSIMQKEKEIEKIKADSNKKESNKIYDINKRLSKLRLEISSLKQENQKDDKRKEKINQKRLEILGEIKQQLTKIDVGLMMD